MMTMLLPARCARMPVIPELKKLKQDCHKLQASLIVSFRIAWATEQAPASNQTQAMLVPVGNMYRRTRTHTCL